MKLHGKYIYHGTDGHPFTNLFWKMVWGVSRFGRSQPYMAQAFYEIGNYLVDPEQAKTNNEIVEWAEEGSPDYVSYYNGKRID